MATKNSNVVELVDKIEEYFQQHPIHLSSGDTLRFSRKPQTLHFEVGGAMLDVGGKAASDTFPCSFWTNVEGLPRGKGFGVFRALEKPATTLLANVDGFATDLTQAVASWFGQLPTSAASAANSASDSPETGDADDAQEVVNASIDEKLEYLRSHGQPDATTADAINAMHHELFPEDSDYDFESEDTPHKESERSKSALASVTDYPDEMVAFALALGENLQGMFQSFGDDVDELMEEADEDDLNWFRYELAAIYGEALQDIVGIDLRGYELRGEGFDEETDGRILAKFIEKCEANPARLVDALGVSDATHSTAGSTTPQVTREMAEITSRDMAQLLLRVQRLVDRLGRKIDKIMSSLDLDDPDDWEKWQNAAQKIANKYELPVEFIREFYPDINDAIWALEPALRWFDGADARYEERDHTDDPEGEWEYSEDERKLILIDRAVTWDDPMQPLYSHDPGYSKSSNLNTWYKLRFILTKSPGELAQQVEWREGQEEMPEGVRARLSVPAAVAVALAGSPYAEVRSNVAENTTTPVEALIQMVADPDDDVRVSLARNGNTPADVLRILASDTNGDVVSSVGEHSHTPIDTLRQLAAHERWGPRCSVAGNANTPLEVIIELADDPEYMVRTGVARNTSTPAELLANLLHDENEYVRLRAKQNPNTPNQDPQA